MKPHLTANPFSALFFDISAIDCNTATANLVQTSQEGKDRAFARTRSPNDGTDGIGPQTHVQPFKDTLLLTS